MDCDTAGYKQARYDEIANEMKSMLVKVGWKKDFVEKSTPVLPISGWMGDNLLKKSDNMGWWKGADSRDDMARMEEEEEVAKIRSNIGSKTVSTALLQVLMPKLLKMHETKYQPMEKADAEQIMEE